MEINFIDVGQGDGAHIQTPDDKAMIIDAGQADNMYRFLRWRFGKFAKTFTFENMVVTHPDQDHYYGFKPLFEHTKVKIKKLFHNCIVEQVTSGKSSLGKTEKPAGVTKQHITGIVLTRDNLKEITDSSAKRGARLYPNLMHTAETSGRVGDIAGLLASEDPANPAYLPGFAPADNRGMTIKILGPFPTTLSNGKVSLPSFGSNGITKNGHSVILQVEIGQVKIQLGGDLNETSQDYLLEKYTGLSHPPKNMEAEIDMIEAARPHFEADVTKSCHHGSSDVSTTFMRAVNPIATVVSSGDDEPHGHPRPDTLGLIGKHGRGERPLIFSTELARSSKEIIKHPNVVRKELRDTLQINEAILADPGASPLAKTNAEAKIQKALEKIERSVANYGMINLRTDGKNILLAQRLETERSKKQRWDIHLLEPDQNKRLKYRR
ncbi:ComEC/Rec2 family competence protein [Parasphingorhabdus sp.]|uniref:ComEC/Rec2 family competence protein n=1 Tax=Parasphingorhabdus sp. TaxID=2709688 RepID=UPI003002751C